MQSQCTECGLALTRTRNPTPFCSPDCALRALINGRAEADRVRFLKKLQPGEDGECWRWLAGLASNGYGAFSISCRQIGAHRVAFALANGHWPSQNAIRHACDNRACVNPAHLSAGTQAENIADRDRQGHNIVGSRHRLAKLTEADVIEMRRRRVAGESCPSLARTFGIGKKHAWRVVNHKVWTHV
jgi:endogenous inhibitor of DNA gyrase (YacG/DUF329 family)